MSDAPNGSTLAPTEILFYSRADGQTQVQVRLFEETVWLTQRLMADLYGKDVRTVNEHLKNIYEEGELDAQATIRKFRIVQTEGKREVSRFVEHYSLPAIIAVGFRVRSPQGTKFRQWATAHLEEYLVKGFTMDDERLKNPPGPDAPDYFEELLARLRAIRTSEKRFYKTILEVYATSMDYDSKSDASRAFFAKVQNKMHWAAHGHTAAELIAARADASKPNMGLTTWPGDAPRKADARVAKNYLSREELEPLDSIVNAYLEFAKLQAAGRRPMYMKDWIGKLDDFLALSDHDVLAHAGKVTAEAARLKAEQEYLLFAEQQSSLPSRVEQDFEAAMAEMKLLAAGRKEGEDE